MEDTTKTLNVGADEKQPHPASSLDFYPVEPSDLGESGRKLLIEYSKIPPDEVYEHANNLRKKAFAVWPYPCIAMFRFLDLSLLTSKVYPEVLERLKKGEIFLDLGCCFGQEIRQLVFNGVPSENLYGSDLRKDYMDVGYELFKDKDTLKATFISADVFDDDSALVKQLTGKVNIVYVGSFFHLFNYDDQVKIAKRVIQLLKPEKGGLVIGRQVGNVAAGEYKRSGYHGETQRYRHNEQSWKDMWEKVGQITNTKWEVDVSLDEVWMTKGAEGLLTRFRNEGQARRMTFTVRRID